MVLFIHVRFFTPLFLFSTLSPIPQPFFSPTLSLCWLEKIWEQRVSLHPYSKPDITGHFLIATWILKSQKEYSAATPNQTWLRVYVICSTWATGRSEVEGSQQHSHEKMAYHAHSGDNNPCQSFVFSTHILTFLLGAVLPKHSQVLTLCISFCHTLGLKKKKKMQKLG